MGIGLVSRKYRIEEIKSCKAVKNPILAGVGIRLISNGWLYNVSGSYAVELAFKNRKSIVRIGTDQPEKVAEEINRLINSNKTEISGFEKETSGYYISAIIIFLVLFFPAILMIYGSREPGVIVKQDEFTIKGMYGLSVKYSSISSVDTVTYLPKIRLRTNGFALASILKGNFTLSDNSRVKLFIRKGVSPYIHIETADNVIYFNFKDPGKTRNLYNDLLIRTSR
jgi:hypothetical protein